MVNKIFADFTNNQPQNIILCLGKRQPPRLWDPKYLEILMCEHIWYTNFIMNDQASNLSALKTFKPLPINYMEY